MRDMCVLFVIITLFLVTEGWKLLIKKIIIGISFVRNVIFIENSLFLKMMPGGFKKKHILAALYTSVPLHKH